MLQRIRSRLSYANVAATLALFIALGGVSYAAVKLPKNSVGTVQIKKNAVNGAKVRNSSLTGSDVKNRSLTAADFSGSVQGAQGPAGAPGPKGDTGPAGPIQGTPAGGALTGTYPSPGIAQAAAPVLVADNPAAASDPCLPSGSGQTMVLCGTTAQRWIQAEAPSAELAVWRDQIGQVHIRGQAYVNTGSTSTLEAVFHLPAELRPKRYLEYPIFTTLNVGSQAALAGLTIEPSGAVVGARQRPDATPASARRDRVPHRRLNRALLALAVRRQPRTQLGRRPDHCCFEAQAEAGSRSIRRSITD